MGVKDEMTCDSGNLCVLGSCNARGLCDFTHVSCSDEDDDQCTIASCDPTDGVCRVQSEILCDDNNACTSDECVDGRCVHTEKTCSHDLADVDASCVDSFCNRVTGECEIVPVECPDIEDGCLIGTCQGGSCAYEAKTCESDDPCEIGYCSHGTCLFSSIVCGNNNPCVSQECVDGECVATPIDCGVQGCFVGHCNPTSGTCEYTTPRTCDDGNPCTRDLCENGECVHPVVECENTDDDLCTIEFCRDGECVSEDMNCDDDDDACTEDYCEDGECKERDGLCPGQFHKDHQRTLHHLMVVLLLLANKVNLLLILQVLL